MNTYFFPRPSLCGAILWQRSRHVHAVTPSGRVFGWTFLGLVTLIPVFVFKPTAPVVGAYWPLTLAAFALANIVASSVVTIGHDGVNVRRVLAGLRIEGGGPLGGEFRRTIPRFPNEPDHDEEIDFNEDDGARWAHYRVGDDSIAFACLFPSPTVDWLNAQLHRIEASQLPRAHVVESPRAGEDGRDRSIE